MNLGTILDTGPLIAFLNSRDGHHRWAREQWARVEPPFLTCEAVIAEACFLAQRLGSGAPEAVVSLVERGVLDVSFRLADEAAAVARVMKVMKKYDDVPMSLADACLVRMSEQHPGSVVLTLDGDFRIYRRSGRHPIPTRMPGA
ncbi:MAG: PIN domain-containing protein [Gemmatimonadales bacterium]|nr:PIN domain-containing protein [Gemmatimonadales bacterium]MYG48636.1 PIN domain-containing protein [Gemmatimonadales bacterium]MYK01740.1 PIN domain-containing protein [Candidatus Palauibacter ramosifaciens]